MADSEAFSRQSNKPTTAGTKPPRIALPPRN